MLSPLQSRDDFHSRFQVRMPHPDLYLQKIRSLPLQNGKDVFNAFRCTDRMIRIDFIVC